MNDSPLLGLFAATLVFSPLALADFTPINGKMASPKTLNAMIHLPAGYDADRAQGYPLLIAVHGNGKCGNASIANGDGTYSLDLNILNRVTSEGAPKMIRDGLWDQTLPFIVLAPQLPPNQSGNKCGLYKDRYEMVYEHAIQNYNVDLRKVYVTGLSQGGNGTYNAVVGRPDTIAAAIPVAGWYPQAFNCEAIRDIGIWAFHGDKDGTVDYNWGKGTIDKLDNCGNSGTPLLHPAKLTSFKDVPHNSWDGAYGVKSHHTFSSDNKKHYYNELAYDHRSPTLDAAGNFGGDGYYYHYNEFGRHVLYRWLLSFTKPLDGGPNQPPLFNDPGAVSLQEGDTLSLEISAADPDGDSLTLALMQDASGLAEFVDHGNGTATLSLSAPAGSQGEHGLLLRATDTNGGSADLALAVTVEAASAEGDGRYMRLFGNDIAWNQYRLFRDGLWSGDFDLPGMGHDTLVLHLRNLGAAALPKLHVHLSDALSNKDYGVDLHDYAAVGSDWIKVQIPLAHFAERGVDLAHFRSFRLLFGPSTSLDLAVDEIRFSGGAEDFVLYGAAHRAGAFRTNGNLSAAETEGADVGG